MLKTFLRLFVLGTAVLLLVACSSSEPEVLRLATTTSTEDSGLLEAILPDFEEQHNARVDVVAVGTGQAIALGEAGDADVILVHARSREDAFVADGHGIERADVMYNDFIIVGPTDDPAGIQGVELASEALTAIAESESTFASRGDDSGTHSKERSLWEAAGLSLDPEGDWYKSLGQGMGDTLRFANESGAYTMTDRGTFLSQQDNLPNLAIMVGGNSIDENVDLSLYNPYGVIPVNPDKGNINNDLANDFVAWLTSVDVQAVIAEYGIDTFGQPLFYPDSQAWRDQ
ncbi:substrate-binding domain-containing protein [Candidatus Leptofilum sp.]|uniref:substrate-binding domain-containing protein n=1 Tax=Candidatus Leptofilum sp. TaxID=3241576 RepID=UPI003B5CCF50